MVMPWKPSKLTTTQLEERRQRAAELFTANEINQASIARELEVSSAAVSKWHTTWLEGGANALSAKPHPGPGRSISAEDQQKLLDAVKQRLKAGSPAEGPASPLASAAPSLVRTGPSALGGTSPR